MYVNDTNSTLRRHLIKKTELAFLLFFALVKSYPEKKNV